MRRTRTAVLVPTLVLMAAVIGSACSAPGGGGTPPGWTSTRLARTVTPSEVVNRLGAWTDDDWFATVEASSPTSGSPSTNLAFYPRTGPGGTGLGAPQMVPLPASGGLTGPMGEHIVGLPTSTGASFFVETAGVWGAAGELIVPEGWQLSAMTDDWAAVRRVPGAPGFSGDGAVRIYSIDASGPTVVATLATTLGPDPTWPTALREGFGMTVALDGDVAAVSAAGLFDPAPGGVRIFRATAGTWSAVQSLGGIAGPESFGRNLAISDGPTVDRLALSPNADIPASTAIEIHADTGSGFTLEQVITRDPLLPDTSNGTWFGASMALDGDLLAITARSTTVPSAQPGHDPVTVGYVQMYRRGPTSWTREAEVGTFPTPYDPGITSAIPFRLQAAGNHVAVLVLMSPDPPPGCSFPCFYLGMEAWSIDRL